LRALVPLLALLLLAGCGGRAKAPVDDLPGLVVRATVDRSLVESGEDLVYTVALDWDPAVSPVIPEFGRDIEGLRITGERLVGPEEVDGRQTQTFLYDLVADRPGSYEIPGVEVTYMDAEGERGVAETEAILIEASAPPPEDEQDADRPPIQLDEQLRDIEGPQTIRDPNVALWLIVAVGLFLVSGTVWSWISRRRWAAPPPPPAPLAAHVRALRDLEQLRSEGLLQRGETQTFAYELSGIFRRYLERRFGFPAVEWTTTEILRGLPEPLRAVRREGDIQQVLDATDLVKYAGHEIGAGEMERLADVCKGLVTTTAGGEDLSEESSP